MTTREEIHARIDALSDDALERVATLLEQQKLIDQKLEAIRGLSGALPKEEWAEFDQAVARQSWRAGEE